VTDAADDVERFNPAALEMLRRVGNGSLLIRMIDIFLSNTPERIEVARTGVQTNDLHAVEFAAHSLKSSSAQLGGVSLQRASAAVEKAAVSGDVNAVSTGFDLMCTEFEQMRAWLEKIKAEAIDSAAASPS
jgi:HPt (histidine-containing phosphotransfer) domain-containing protein